MSLAKSFTARAKTAKCIETLKLKMQVCALSCKSVGDDHIYTLTDGTKLLDRRIVNEWQVFKG